MLYVLVRDVLNLPHGFRCVFSACVAFGCLHLKKRKEKKRKGGGLSMVRWTVNSF